MTTPPFLAYGTAVGTGSSATEWADAILEDLGAPESTANIQSLVDWFEQEGGGGQNNPLNTTLVTSGSSGSINSVGVQSYSSPAAGAQADAATIAGGNYPAIYSALQSGQGIINSSSSAVASELSEWSGGGYSSVSGTPAVSSSSSAQTTSDILGFNTSIFNTMSDFFGDLISADFWERGSLMLFGVILILVGIIILATPTIMSGLGIAAQGSRQTRAISRMFGSNSGSPGGPTDEEKAERQSRLDLANRNTALGEKKAELQARRMDLSERRMGLAENKSRVVREKQHPGGYEPNPEPPHG